jgi:hypothetical protein
MFLVVELSFAQSHRRAPDILFCIKIENKSQISSNLLIPIRLSFMVSATSNNHANYSFHCPEIYVGL